MPEGGTELVLRRFKIVPALISRSPPAVPGLHPDGRWNCWSRQSVADGAGILSCERALTDRQLRTFQVKMKMQPSLIGLKWLRTLLMRRRQTKGYSRFLPGAGIPSKISTRSPGYKALQDLREAQQKVITFCLLLQNISAYS